MRLSITNPPVSVPTESLKKDYSLDHWHFIVNAHKTKNNPSLKQVEGF